MTLPADVKNGAAEVPEGAIVEGPIVYVCVTCRKAGDAEDGPRAGLLLAEAAAEAARGTGIAVRHVECLANCRRSLSAAMRKKDSWTYVFGELSAPEDAAALIDGARMLAVADDGLLPWRGRPDVLKGGLIARVPPLVLAPTTCLPNRLGQIPEDFE